MRSPIAVLMVVVLVLLATLPWSITWITERSTGDPYYARYLVILAYSGIMAELIFWQAHGIMGNVNRGCVFSANTVRRMRVMAVETLVLAVFYLATMFWMSKFFMAALLWCLCWPAAPFWCLPSCSARPTSTKKKMI